MVKISLREDQIQFIEATLVFIGNLCGVEVSGPSLMRKFMSERTKERSDEILSIIRDA